METNYKHLCDILGDVNLAKVTHPQLRRILAKCKQTEHGFVFFKGKHHRDHTSRYVEGEDEEKSEYSEHTDHSDHYDYNETSHSDSPYDESAPHTDSSGGHGDYNEASHKDYEHGD